MFKGKQVLKKKIIWYSIFVISALSIILLAFGFISAIMVTHNANTSLGEKTDGTGKTTAITSSRTLKNEDLINIIIMGDSIARGTGDETGKGLSGYIPFYFRNLTSKEIAIENIGINGLDSEGLLKQLQSGRTDKLIQVSDFIVISIGGNDAREILSVKDTSREDEFNNILDRYILNLKESIKIIRTINSSCIIIAIEIYNPYQSENPYDGGMLVNNWNFKTKRLIGNDLRAVSIPTFSMFKFNTGRFLAPDGLHPNSAGYRMISDLISKSVESYLVKE